VNILSLIFLTNHNLKFKNIKINTTKRCWHEICLYGVEDRLGENAKKFQILPSSKTPKKLEVDEGVAVRVPKNGINVIFKKR
jgi:hypothetical protein